MENQLPQPQFAPQTPPSGWWKLPSTIATDPVFLRVPDESRLATLALYVASVGWTLNHNREDGWVPTAAILFGQVCPAPTDELKTALQALIHAGLAAEVTVEGISGVVVAGASKAVRDRYARQNSASVAGKASAESQRKSFRKYPPKYERPDPNKSVDWSQVSEDL